MAGRKWLTKKDQNGISVRNVLLMFLVGLPKLKKIAFRCSLPEPLVLPHRNPVFFRQTRGLRDVARQTRCIRKQPAFFQGLVGQGIYNHHMMNPKGLFSSSKLGKKHDFNGGGSPGASNYITPHLCQP